MPEKRWNWQQDDWPNFSYCAQTLNTQEAQFLINAGLSFGICRHINDREKQDIVIQLISEEAYKTSEIEGELLDRASLQSSIKRHFGYQISAGRQQPQEAGVAEMMMDLYHHYDKPLDHEQLWEWHLMLMNGRRDLDAIGRYRTHEDPMQVVSGHYGRFKIHFEAPPSTAMDDEMNRFIQWFNRTAPNGPAPLPPLTRASITHLYFVAIHPFEDGNGRIARALVEKTLAQYLRQPTLIALSQVIQRHRKDYYRELEWQNKHNTIDGWLRYFANTLLEAQTYTVKEMEFIIEKTRFFDDFGPKMNSRQHKVITRIFAEGTQGFKGGLSAKNYISIAHTTASTATRDLQALVTMGALHKIGDKKASRYYLSSQNK